MSNIKLNLKKNVAYIKIDNVLTKNSLDRNDLKRITDFLIKIGDQNLTCLVISSSGDIFSSGMNLKELSDSPKKMICGFYLMKSTLL